ncbi:ubiquitin-like protein ATG12 isoform X2 [Colius striatus]|uniref:ubiquitin-like protein ATG12 isoform X2 n=1 Tax=Colius striatus TaxID=57412 RepID=UPI002B1D6371|nr:ubiquitin-like protein ATG12 isoform X2 [Colius striatus]
MHGVTIKKSDTQKEYLGKSLGCLRLTPSFGTYLSSSLSTVLGLIYLIEMSSLEICALWQHVTSVVYVFFPLKSTGPSDNMFIYVNQSFAPSPDQEVGTLYECFGSDGKLVLHYCKTQAWG